MMNLGFTISPSSADLEDLANIKCTKEEYLYWIPSPASPHHHFRRYKELHCDSSQGFQAISVQLGRDSWLPSAGLTSSFTFSEPITCIFQIDPNLKRLEEVLKKLKIVSAEVGNFLSFWKAQSKSNRLSCRKLVK